MSGMNKAIIQGRLGKDPEVRTLPTGAMVANISVATSEKYKDKTTGETKEITDWHSIVAYQGTAEIASKFLKKGDQVLIEGKIRTRSWEKDSITRYTTEIICDRLVLLGGNRNTGAEQPSSQTSKSNSMAEETSSAAASYAGTTDDLPF